MSARRPRLGRRARRAARRLVGVAAAVAVVLVVVRAVLGVWATAALLAVVAVAGLIAGWAAVEDRCFRRAAPRPPVRELTVTDHVAFARALAAVATAYLTACERQEHRR